MIVQSIIFICLLHYSVGYNDNPILMKQYWTDLYASVNDPYIPPTGTVIALSTQIENIEYSLISNGLICRVTFHLISEWKIDKIKILKNKLVETSRGIFLDMNRVWHPRFVFINARNVRNLGESMEIRTHNENKGGTYFLKQSFNVEVYCENPNNFSPVSAVPCAILMKQDGRLASIPSVEWKRKHGCLVGQKAFENAYHITITKKSSEFLDRDASVESMAVNICWAGNGGFNIRQFLPLTINTCLALFALWCRCPKIRALVHTANLLTQILLWKGFTETDLSSSSVPGVGSSNLSVGDLWSTVCLITISFSFVIGLLPVVMASHKQHNKMNVRFHDTFSLGKIQSDYLPDLQISPDFTNCQPMLHPNEGSHHRHCHHCSTPSPRHLGEDALPVESSSSSFSTWELILRIILPLGFFSTTIILWVVLLTKFKLPEECLGKSECDVI